MRKYLMPIYIVFFLIGATALWYFGHHRPAQKILEAEPKRVYKSVPLQPADLSVKPTPSDAIQEPRESVEGIAESEDIDNAAMSEKIDDSQVHSEDTDSVALILQEAISDEDAAAAEAFKKYVTAESEYQAAQERLEKVSPFKAAQERLEKVFPFKDTDPAHEAKEAFAASDYQAVIEGLQKVIASFEHMDRDQIRSAVEAYKEAKLRRNESLENLAIYSEEAAKMLAQVKEAERRENEARTESELRSITKSDLRELLEKLE